MGQYFYYTVFRGNLFEGDEDGREDRHAILLEERKY